jgi:hypothetical protein
MFRRSLTALVAVSILLSSPVLTLQARQQILIHTAPPPLTTSLQYDTSVTSSPSAGVAFVPPVVTQGKRIYILDRSGRQGVS